MPDPTLQTDPRPTPQPPDAPPRRTLTQTQPQPAKDGQSLFVALRAFEAYDDDIFGQQETGGEAGVGNVSSGGPFGTVDPRFRQSGTYSGVSSALVYSKWKKLKRGALSINGNGVASYEGIRTDNRTIGQGRVEASASTSVGNWQVGATGGAAYAPFYQLLVILPPQIREAVDVTDETLTRETDYVLLSQRAALIQTNASVSRNFKRSMSLGVSYSVARTEFLPGGQQTDSIPGGPQIMPSGAQTAQQARLTLSRRIQKGVSLRLGYGYNQYEFGHTLSTPTTRTHDIEAGIDYSRPLSFSRRTTLRLSTGSAIAEQYEFGSENRTYRFYLTGTADLAHEMGRTWVAIGAVRRGLDFVAGFREPLLTNTVSAGIGGHPRRRVELTALSYYSMGMVGLRSSAPPYGSTTANARLTVTLTRRVRTFGEYFYDRYHVGAGVDLPLGFAQAFDRRGARASVVARLAGPLDAYAEYIDYRYSFDTSVNLPPGSPRSFDRHGARVGLRLGIPILSPATRGITQ